MSETKTFVFGNEGNAANNIKRFAFRNINTVGATEIYACGDMNRVTCSAQEACDFSRGWLTLP